MNLSKAILSPTALLIRSDSYSSDDCHIEGMLDFFGIPWTALTITDAKQDSVARLIADHSRFSILVSAKSLADILQSGKNKTLPGFMTSAASVFVYGFQTTDECRNLLREITGDMEADVLSLGERPTSVSIADDFPEICGPMSGLEMQLEPGAADSVLAIRRTVGEFQSLASAPEGHLFAKFTHAGVRFYVDASRTAIDIHQRAVMHFDVKKTFAGAVPIAMYLKWSFRDICWRAPKTNACLIIDDPPLKAKYGFLDYRELLKLTDRQRIAVTIAFIPWNWRRTNRATVASIQKHNEKLSICTHGCDHSGGEFASRSSDRLDRILKTAKYRMQALLERTGLQHDNVQVFPQGAFSPELGKALKENGYIAAVNTHASPLDSNSNETTIADLWSIAVLRYGGFPIFTRRYIDQGIENFAFDGLLGKPCFVAGHHDLFRDRSRKLLEFLDRLKSLRWELSWRTLGNAVCRSYSVQDRAGTTRVKMFAEQLILENISEAPKQFTVLKEEAYIDGFKGVSVDGESYEYKYASGCIQFVVNVTPGSRVEIRCDYYEKEHTPTSSEPLIYKLKIAIRRYLSEIRDTYVSGNGMLNWLLTVAMRLLKQPAEPSA